MKYTEGWSIEFIGITGNIKNIGNNEEGEMEDEKLKKMAEALQKMDKQLDEKDIEVKQLKKERDWVIQDFIKSLRYHYPGTTEEWHRGNIEEAMANALRG